MSVHTYARDQGHFVCMHKVKCICMYSYNMHEDNLNLLTIIIEKYKQKTNKTRPYNVDTNIMDNIT